MLGIIIIIITMGISTIVGVVNEANRFSFILFLRGWCIDVC